jgi:lysyl-tRNA synthetase, class I
MHWADVLAKEAVSQADRHVLATAITPSGPIHVGNMREVLTTEMVARSLRDVEKVETELIYIADSYDPLRKVYPFLDPNVYEPFVGRPLVEIPCPCADHKSYAEHFLKPFLKALDDLGVEMKVLDAYQMYREGRYKEEISEAMGATPRVRTIIEEASGRRLPKDWIPFNIQCQGCKRLTNTRPLRVDQTEVEYTCVCGHHGRIDVTHPGAGKLPWRIDWPARWRFLGVTFEAMGKDHAAAGGSWDTGIRLAKEIFGIEPPTRTVYEFIQLKGVGAMHSSTGTAVSAEDVLKMTPPEVLRFFIAKNQPNKHLDFDPGLGILDLVDEYDSYERAHHGAEEGRAGMKDIDRTYVLSQPRRVPAQLPFQIPYRHLVTVVQVAGEASKVPQILARGGLDVAKLDEQAARRFAHRIEHVSYWLARFAPESVKFTLQSQAPTIEFSADERSLVALLATRLADVAWDAQSIHDAVHGASVELGLKPGDAFRTVYKAFLAKTSGPRAGFFLAALERDFVVERLRALLPNP